MPSQSVLFPIDSILLRVDNDKDNDPEMGVL